MKRHIPNFITILNLLAGCFAIVSISKGELTAASWWIIAAAAFDLMDGLVARLTGTVSDIGKQLDSLADIVSFGVAPAYILYVLIGNAIGISDQESSYGLYIPYAAFVIPAFAALRLARFNIDEEQVNNFKGLPTPAAAFLILSFPLILNCKLVVIPWLNTGLSNPWVLLALSVTISVLMVSSIPLFSLKFKSIFWKYNRSRFIFIIAAIGLFLYLRFASVPFILLLYIILSLLNLNEPEEL
jgi:CDP-diacylglycerol--serine O-phosphatidyltransferase